MIGVRAGSIQALKQLQGRRVLAVNVHSWASGVSREYTGLGVISEYLQGCLTCPQPGRLELAVLWALWALEEGEERESGVTLGRWPLQR